MWGPLVAQKVWTSLTKVFDTEDVIKEELIPENLTYSTSVTISNEMYGEGQLQTNYRTVFNHIDKNLDLYQYPGIFPLIDNEAPKKQLEELSGAVRDFLGTCEECTTEKKCNRCIILLHALPEYLVPGITEADLKE